MLKLDMSQALSRPETIRTNENIFRKEIKKTNNNENTTCLDLLLKKVPINSYISNVGTYNLVNFTNVYTPERRTQYTFTDFSQPCPVGWSNQNGECVNWWSYTGPCNSGRFTSGFRNCRWQYTPRTCSHTKWVWEN
jgi:hypothetical protein